jgi:hypothetical protein
MLNFSFMIKTKLLSIKKKLQIKLNKYPIIYNIIKYAYNIVNLRYINLYLLYVKHKFYILFCFLLKKKFQQIPFYYQALVSKELKI